MPGGNAQMHAVGLCFCTVRGRRSRLALGYELASRARFASRLLVNTAVEEHSQLLIAMQYAQLRIAIQYAHRAVASCQFLPFRPASCTCTVCRASISAIAIGTPALRAAHGAAARLPLMVQHGVAVLRSRAPAGRALIGLWNNRR